MSATVEVVLVVEDGGVAALDGVEEPLEVVNRQGLEVFVATAIGVREAQKTRSGTGHHAQLMESYRAAHTKWLLDRENFSNGYPAEQREYEDLFPRPKLKDFMRAHRHQKPA